jgi:hypothetical protein
VVNRIAKHASSANAYQMPDGALTIPSFGKSSA